MQGFTGFSSTNGFARRLMSAFSRPDRQAGASAATKPLVVTYRTPEGSDDKRVDYNTELLRLALEHTRTTDGDYRLVPSPTMDHHCAMDALRKNVYPNFFIVTSYESSFARDPAIAWVHFPVDLGITGHRICFLSVAIKDAVARDAETGLDALRRWTHGQCADWVDVRILRHNGFTVSTVSDYECLFRLVATRRFDLLSRSANQLYEEYRRHGAIPDLDFDESFELVYPLLRLFFTHSSNRTAADRIERGLQMAWRDGSLTALWQWKYGASLAFTKLGSRKRLWLENPLLEGIDFEYQGYLYHPADSRSSRPA